MRTHQAIASVITLDRDGIALAQQTGGAANLTLNGVGSVAGVATLSPPRRVAIFSGGNIAAVVFTITGTDRAGSAITDTITGVNNTTVSTNKLFASVTRVAAGAAVGTDAEVGWTAVSFTPWLVAGSARKGSTWKMRAFFAAAGTCNFDVQGTSQNLNRDRVTGEHPDDLVTLAAAQTGNYTSDNTTPFYVRLMVNSQDVPITLRLLPSLTEV